MRRVSDAADRVLQAILAARAAGFALDVAIDAAQADPHGHIGIIAAVHAERAARAEIAESCADLTRLAMEAGR